MLRRQTSALCATGLEKQVPKQLSPESMARQAMLAIGIVDSGRWFTRARGHVLAAEEVEPSVRQFWQRFHEAESGATQFALATGPTTHLPYFMLMGFAAENYLKGLLVAANPKLIRQKAFKGKSDLVRALGGHDLLRVAGKAGIEMDADETMLLYRLTDNIEWFGRYPYALAGDDQVAFQTFPDGRSQDVRLKEADIEPVQRLLRRLQDLSQGVSPAKP